MRFTKKPRTVFDDHRRLSHCKRVTDDCRDRRIAGLRSFDHLDQRHERHRIEEMHADEILRPLERRGEIVDAQARGVGCDHGVGSHQAFDFTEHGVFDFEILDHGLDHHVRNLEVGVIELRPNGCEHRFCLFLCETAAGHLLREPLLRFAQANLELLGLDVLHRHRHAAQCARIRDAAAHDARTRIAVAAVKHEALLRDLATDEFINYKTVAPEDVLRDMDLVIDAVGGPTTDRFLKTLKRGGALFPIFPLAFSGAEEAKKRGVTVSTTQVRSNGAQLAEVARLLDHGTIRLVIDSTYPLADARRAHERAEAVEKQMRLAAKSQLSGVSDDRFDVAALEYA